MSIIIFAPIKFLLLCSIQIMLCLLLQLVSVGACILRMLLARVTGVSRVVIYSTNLGGASSWLEEPWGISQHIHACTPYY